MKRMITVIAAAVLGLAGHGVYADHINDSILDMLRTPINPLEGYLGFQTANHGAEYTGHTDADGKDWSDNYFTIKPIIVTDAAGVAPANAGAAAIDNDLDFTRKIYAQAGLSVRTEAQSAVSKAQFAGIGTSPFDATERVDLADDGSGRSANADTINIYYVKEFTTASNGITRNAANAGAGNPYTYLRDNRANNTHAHEIGHMVFNGPVVHMQDPGDAAHSTDITNLMFTTDAGTSGQLNDVGPKINTAGGNIGNHDILTGPQIEAIHGNPGANNPGYIKHGEHIATHGDRADFEWVTDHRTIESMGSGNGADLRAGVDYLVWEIGGVDMSTHTGPTTDAHAHGGLGELDLPAFAGNTFRTVDVVSNINRYADNGTDVDMPGDAELVRRSKALDYQTPQFSTDGNSWVNGSLVNVYKRGWTGRTDQEDYVARWSSPVDAKFVRIAASGVNVVGHDGNTQIDAVIAAPEVIPYTPKWFQLDPTYPVTDSGPSAPPIVTRAYCADDGPDVPVEIVAMSLQSVQPINVQGYTGGGFEEASSIAYHFTSEFDGPGTLQMNGLLEIFNELNQFGQVLPYSAGPDLFSTDFTGSEFDITFQVEIPGRRQQWYLVHGELLDPALTFGFVSPFIAGPGSISSVGIDLGVFASGALPSGEFMQWTVTAAQVVPEPACGVLLTLAGVTLIRRRRAA